MLEDKMKEITASHVVTVTKNPIMKKNFASKIEKMRGQKRAVADAIFNSGTATLADLMKAVHVKTRQSKERVVRYYVSILKTSKFVTVR
jgi:hypothetical protein